MYKNVLLQLHSSTNIQLAGKLLTCLSDVCEEADGVVSYQEPSMQIMDHVGSKMPFK